MNKVICVGAAAFSFVIGFLLCAFVFVWSGENTDKWGDLATWVGSGVAFLALVAAIVAAYLGWRSADRQNENSTILSLLTMSESRSKQVENHFVSMEKIISDFFQGDADNFKVESYIAINEYSSSIVDVAREMSRIKIIVSRTISSFKEARISDLAKKNLVEDFFSFVPNLFISECITRSSTEIFFDYSYDEWIYEDYQVIMRNIQQWKLSYEIDVSYIRDVIIQYGLFQN